MPAWSAKRSKDRTPDASPDGPPVVASPRRRLARILSSPGFWGILAVVTTGWLLVFGADYDQQSESLFQRFGVTALVPMVLVHAIVSVSPFPGELVAIRNSMLLGFSLGVVCNWCGWMMGAVIQYGLSRRAAADFGVDRSMINRRIPRRFQNLKMDHPAFLIMGRWLPFGGHIVNTTAGVLSVPLRRHLWCSAISIVPIAILFAGVGHGSAVLFSAW